MGCSSTKPPAFNVDQEYKNQKLAVPEATEYENDFEKEAFMTLNLLRHDPKLFIPHVKEMKGISF